MTNRLRAVLVDDETKKAFLALAGQIDRIYKAILPDPAANADVRVV